MAIVVHVVATHSGGITPTGHRAWNEYERVSRLLVDEPFTAHQASTDDPDCVWRYIILASQPGRLYATLESVDEIASMCDARNSFTTDEEVDKAFALLNSPDYEGEDTSAAIHPDEDESEPGPDLHAAETQHLKQSTS